MVLSFLLENKSYYTLFSCKCNIFLLKRLTLSKQLRIIIILCTNFERLISSGIYGYPKDETLETARLAIGEYLQEHAPEVYLAVFDKSSFLLSEMLLGRAGYALSRASKFDVIVAHFIIRGNYELLHDRIDIQAVSLMTQKEYQVGGTTASALLNAIGKIIQKLVHGQRSTAGEFRAENVMFVITGGVENASWEYPAQRVNVMIEQEPEKYGWEFVFLGASIDAVKMARRFGFAADWAVGLCPTSRAQKGYRFSKAKYALCVKE